MALDRAALGNCASEQMEALEADYGDSDAVHLGAVMTVVEILTPVGEPNEHGQVAVKSDLRLRHNVPDPFRVIGLLDQLKFDLLNT